jgi:hypothetical protein
VNCYSKHLEQQRQSDDQVARGLPSIPLDTLEGYSDLIRFEIQFKYPELYTMKQHYSNLSEQHYKDYRTDRNKKLNELNEEISEISSEVFIHHYAEDREDTRIDNDWVNRMNEAKDILKNEYRDEKNRFFNFPAFMTFVLSDDVCCIVISNYFQRVIMGGDYYTLDRARKIVETMNFRPSKRDRMIHALNIVNDKRGISKAKATLQGNELDRFNITLRELVDISINPVTIPRGHGITRIPNLYNAYRVLVERENITERKKIKTLEYHHEQLNQRKKRKK